jgi:hypothetical protein
VVLFDLLNGNNHFLKKSYCCWIMRRGEREVADWVVREAVGAGGRNDPSLVCT